MIRASIFLLRSRRDTTLISPEVSYAHSDNVSAHSMSGKCNVLQVHLKFMRREDEICYHSRGSYSMTACEFTCWQPLRKLPAAICLAVFSMSSECLVITMKKHILELIFKKKSRKIIVIRATIYTSEISICACLSLSEWKENKSLEEMFDTKPTNLKWTISVRSCWSLTKQTEKCHCLKPSQLKCTEGVHQIWGRASSLCSDLDLNPDWTLVAPNTMQIS